MKSNSNGTPTAFSVLPCLRGDLPFLAIAVLLLAAAIPTQALAQSSYPMLMSLKPVAAQVGQTSEHMIASRHSMYGAFAVLVTGEGVTGEIIPPEAKDAKPDDKGIKPNITSLKVRFHVAPDALPGVRDFRIATMQGVSTLGQLVIARDPVVSENVANDTAAQAQAVTVPGTICGAIEKAEDVDVFKFTVAAGEKLSFHVRSMRLQDRIHDLQTHVDPIIAIRNSTGSTLAASDNFFYGDPFLSQTFDQAGEYLLEIRDVRYQGNPYWEYCVEISRRPFVSNVHPLGMSRGQPVNLELVGTQLPPTPMIAVQPPMELPCGPSWLTLPMGEEATNPVPVVVSDLPSVLEITTDNNTPVAGQPIAIPAAISGRIESENDVDYFVFEAKKGERYSFDVIARRQQSQLDSHLRIVDLDGGQMTLNDDQRIDKRNYADSRIDNWVAPADAKYAIEIRDLHLRGGPGFVYFIEAKLARPSFQLFIDTDKTLLTPATNGVLFVRIERRNGFEGGVLLDIDGLPPGVTATCGRILPGKGQEDGCIVLQAFPNAPLAAANVTVRGTADVEIDGRMETLTATAIPYQETYQPGGGRGHWPVDLHTVSIAAPTDIQAVRISEPDIVLKPGESKRIDVEIVRGPGFDKNVTLDVTYNHLAGIFGSSLPPGVKLDLKNSQTLLTGAATTGHITLVADPTAPPVVKQQIVVMANVSINFVMKTTYASRPLTISVLPAAM